MYVEWGRQESSHFEDQDGHRGISYRIALWIYVVNENYGTGWFRFNSFQILHVLPDSQ